MGGRRQCSGAGGGKAPRCLLASVLLHGAGVALGVWLVAPGMARVRPKLGEFVCSVTSVPEVAVLPPVPDAALPPVLVEDLAEEVAAVAEPPLPDLEGFMPDPEPAVPEMVVRVQPPVEWTARMVKPVAAVPEVAAAAAPPPAPAAVKTDPQPQEDNRPPEYPALAIRSGHQGTVVLRIDVDARGRVDDCAVASSSGHAELDAAALRAARDWRFRDGPGCVLLPVEFVLGRRRV